VQVFTSEHQLQFAEHFLQVPSVLVTQPFGQ